MSGGLLRSAQRLLAHVVALAHTRLELLSVELQEELARLAAALFGMLVVLLLATLGLAFVGWALVMWLDEQWRVAAAATLGLVFLVASALIAFVLRRQARPAAFSASLAELKRDSEALAPRP